MNEGKEKGALDILWWLLYAGAFVFAAWVAVQLMQHWGILACR